MASTFFCCSERCLPQCASVGCGYEKSLYGHFSRSRRKKVICAELRAMSWQQFARNRAGPRSRQRNRQERKTRGVVLVHYQRKAGIGHALMGEPTSTRALADHNFPPVAVENESRSAVSMFCRKSFTTERTESWSCRVFSVISMIDFTPVDGSKTHVALQQGMRSYTRRVPFRHCCDDAKSAITEW
jgi:hypothetical protein